MAHVDPKSVSACFDQGSDRFERVGRGTEGGNESSAAHARNRAVPVPEGQCQLRRQGGNTVHNCGLLLAPAQIYATISVSESASLAFSTAIQEECWKIGVGKVMRIVSVLVRRPARARIITHPSLRDVDS